MYKKGVSDPLKRYEKTGLNVALSDEDGYYDKVNYKRIGSIFEVQCR